MTVFVCIKLVPDTETKLSFKNDGSGIDYSNIKWIINPNDEHALEAALKWKDTCPTLQVKCICVCPEKINKDILKTALALGADEATLITYPDYLLETHHVVEILSHIITTQKNDLLAVWVGSEAIDDHSASVGPMLAQVLNLPYISNVTFCEMNDQSVLVHKELDQNIKAEMNYSLPLVLGACRALNVPRYATLSNIMKAKKKNMTQISISEIPISSHKYLEFHDWFLPPQIKACTFFQGSLQEQIEQLFDKLKNEAKVI